MAHADVGSYLPKNTNRTTSAIALPDKSKNCFLSPNAWIISPAMIMAGAAAGGVLGGFAAAALWVGGVAFAESSKDKSKHIPFVYNKYDGFFSLGATSVVVGGMLALGAYLTAANRNDGFLDSAYSTAITEVLQGKKTDTEYFDLTSPKMFGAYDVIERQPITAEKIGTEGACSKIRINQSGYKPYVIAVRPNAQGNGYEACYRPPRLDNE